MALSASPTPKTSSLRRLLPPLLYALPFLLAVAHAVAEFQRLQIVLLAVLPLALVVFLNVEFGLAMVLAYATTVIFIKRMMPNLDSNQMGVVLDGLICLMALRLAIDLLRTRRWQAFASPLTWPVVALAGYLILQVFNPSAPGLTFGIYGTRDTLRVLGFFLVLFYLRGRAPIKRFVQVFLALMVLDAGYGIWQHHHGLLYQEHLWLIESKAFRTHVLQGYVRVFGTVGDAATFGFISITAALLLIGLALSSRGWRLWALLGLTMPCLYAMVLSYSRGPMVAVAAGVAVMLAVSRNWKLAMACVIAGGLGVGALALNGDTRLFDRLMTATNPAEDASFQVRMGYIDTYLPLIVERPFGGGLYTAGASGLAITGGDPIPGTTIGVPTDNLYFKYGLELGWVGLSIFCWFLASCWFWTWRTYQKLKDPFYKALSLGLLGIFTSYIVGAFSNDILVQKPLIEFFYMAVGLSALLGQHREARG
jgi:cell division protein FtsW (lipid II flippase)